MIPNFNHSHVIPPFVGDSPTQLALASPYDTTASELVTRLCTTAERGVLLQGLFAYRQALRALGFVQGFQWLDGSFVEDIEAHEGRAPHDVDVVTFAYKPAGMDVAGVSAMIAAHPEIFDVSQVRRRHGCDAYVVPLDGDPARLVVRAAYYQGLFSHRRSDNVWKGLLKLDMQSDDVVATEALSRFLAGGTDAAST